MEIFTKVIFLKMLEKEEVGIFIKMEIFIMAIGRITKNMVSVFFITKKKMHFIRDFSKITKNRAMGKFIYRKMIFSKDFGKIIKNMEKQSH